MPWSAIAQGLSGLFGSSMGAYSADQQRQHEAWINQQNIAFQQQQNQQNIDFQKATNQENRDFALEMWNKTNAYNSPQAMMKRFKDAGINPYTVASQNTHATPTSYSGTAPKGEAPRMEAGANLYNPALETEGLKMFANMATSYHQNRLINQQAVTQQVQQRLMNMQVVGENLKNISQSLNNESLPEFLKGNLKKLYGDITLTAAKTENQQVENEFQRERIKSELGINDAQMQEIHSRIPLNKANTDSLITNTKRVQQLMPIELRNEAYKIVTMMTAVKQGEMSTQLASQEIEALKANLPAIQEESKKRQGDADFRNNDTIRKIDYFLEKASDVVGLSGEIFRGIINPKKNRKHYSQEKQKDRRFKAGQPTYRR